MTPRKKNSFVFPCRGLYSPIRWTRTGPMCVCWWYSLLLQGIFFFIPSRSPTAPRYEPVQNKGGGDITLSRAIGKRELGWFFDHGSFFFTLGKETSPSPLPPPFSPPQLHATVS